MPPAVWPGGDCLAGSHDRSFRLDKRDGETSLVDRLSFTVGSVPGVVTGFLGPYGSGKSQPSMRMLLG